MLKVATSGKPTLICLSILYLKKISNLIPEILSMIAPAIPKFMFTY